MKKRPADEQNSPPPCLERPWRGPESRLRARACLAHPSPALCSLSPRAIAHPPCAGAVSGASFFMESLTVMRRWRRSTKNPSLGAYFNGLRYPASWPSACTSTGVSASRRVNPPLARNPVKSGPFGPSAAPIPTQGPFDGRPGQPFCQTRADPGPPAYGGCRQALRAHFVPRPAPMPTTSARPAHVPDPHSRTPDRFARNEPLSPLLSGLVASTGLLVVLATSTRCAVADDAAPPVHRRVVCALVGEGRGGVRFSFGSLSKYIRVKK